MSNWKVPEAKSIKSSAAEYLTYIAATGDNSQSVEMRYENENIWLTQKMLAVLYDVEIPTINEHIAKLYSDYELEPEATIRNFRIVQAEGSRQVSREVKHYNLQMIISVGFKVNSDRAVQFRKWVNKIAKDYTIHGWVMDDERLPVKRFYLVQSYMRSERHYPLRDNASFSLFRIGLDKVQLVSLLDRAWQEAVC